MNTKQRLASGLATAGLAATFSAITYYEIQRRQFMARILNGSKLVFQAEGPIEYASEGRGPAILSIHGGGGGYDQGILMKYLTGHDYQVIAPSRFGYLRTPLREDNSPKAQAAAYVQLLDELGVQKTAIIGNSAGGPSSLHFVLDYPERCWGLILISAITQPLPQIQQKLLERFGKIAEFTPGFGAWLTIKGLGLRAVRKLDQAIKNKASLPVQYINQLLLTSLPLNQRLAGGKNDLAVIKNLAPIPLGQISTPALVIHGNADSLVPFSQGKHAAKNIPGAAFLALNGGGHLGIATHMDQTIPVIREFLKRHAPVIDEREKTK